MKRILVGLPLACDYIPKNPRELSSSPTVRRINACICKMQKLKPGIEDCFVVCTAGFTKLSPLVKPVDGHPELPLCKQMQTFIHTNFAQNITVLSSIKGWGTESEIKEGIELARQHISSNDEVTLVVSTNRAHMLRTAIYVWKYLPKSWNVKFVRAHHYFSFPSHKREPLGALHALIGALMYKLLS